MNKIDKSFLISEKQKLETELVKLKQSIHLRTNKTKKIERKKIGSTLNKLTKIKALLNQI